ncbi:hypothetical protein ACFQZE_04205 [Paenibacillus sp. GCM10027627]|uniref:hypothetical protein n=1 Tax=unclassified Paenibacillus TaxID=185978 RepID=UPI003630B49A
MNEEIIITITSNWEKLSEEEMNMVTTVLEMKFKRRIHHLIIELPTFNQDEVIVISNVLKGLLLTKEYVPDIEKAYEQLNGTDLPNKISFGQVRDDD